MATMGLSHVWKKWYPKIQVCIINSSMATLGYPSGPSPLKVTQHPMFDLQHEWTAQEQSGLYQLCCCLLVCRQQESRLLASLIGASLSRSRSAYGCELALCSRYMSSPDVWYACPVKVVPEDSFARFHTDFQLFAKEAFSSCSRAGKSSSDTKFAPIEHPGLTQKSCLQHPSTFETENTSVLRLSSENGERTKLTKVTKLIHISNISATIWCSSWIQLAYQHATGSTGGGFRSSAGGDLWHGIRGVLQILMAWIHSRIVRTCRNMSELWFVSPCFSVNWKRIFFNWVCLE